MLIRALSALVPAAVNGTIGDLAIAAPAGIKGLEALANHAGCVLIEESEPRDALQRAITQARYDDILAVPMDLAAPPGFQLELDALRHAGVRAMIMRCEASGLVTRLLPALSKPGILVAPRPALLELIENRGTGADVSALARRLKGARIMKTAAIQLTAE